MERLVQSQNVEHGGCWENLSLKVICETFAAMWSRHCIAQAPGRPAPGAWPEVRLSVVVQTVQCADGQAAVAPRWGMRQADRGMVRRSGFAVEDSVGLDRASRNSGGPRHDGCSGVVFTRK
ncbi:hypothetical protein NL676_036930 [Syzygium grande]|nr:hypothetical protein NL676_036930 [Syzygium grande]